MFVIHNHPVDRVKNLKAFCHVAKDGMLAIQQLEGIFRQRDEEAGSVEARALIRHSEDAFLFELSLCGLVSKSGGLIN